MIAIGLKIDTFLALFPNYQLLTVGDLLSRSFGLDLTFTNQLG
jgi:hypothetical protein